LVSTTGHQAASKYAKHANHHSQQPLLLQWTIHRCIGAARSVSKVPFAY
jgi:hypothetical protein